MTGSAAAIPSRQKRISHHCPRRQTTVIITPITTFTIMMLVTMTIMMLQAREGIPDASQAIKTNAPQLEPVGSVKVDRKARVLKIRVYRAEDLPCIDVGASPGAPASSPPAPSRAARQATSAGDAALRCAACARRCQLVSVTCFLLLLLPPCVCAFVSCRTGLQPVHPRAARDGGLLLLDALQQPDARVE